MASLVRFTCVQLQGICKVIMLTNHVIITFTHNTVTYYSLLAIKSSWHINYHTLLTFSGWTGLEGAVWSSVLPYWRLPLVWSSKHLPTSTACSFSAWINTIIFINYTQGIFPEHYHVIKVLIYACQNTHWYGTSHEQVCPLQDSENHWEFTKQQHRLYHLTELCVTHT